ncbi:MAG: diguanylate cyclase, partial [Enterocloster bolteae]
MTTADGRGKSRRDTLLPIILCLCFIGSSIIFLVQMILKSQKENVAYLYDAANQTRTSILKQIEGDWQTLEGLAVSLRELVILDENQILTILNDINEENAFIRMGYADINGNARMVDMEGNVEEVNLKGMDFFERALQGEKSISNTFADQQDASGYINYFGVRINDESGNARGVLCAVHSAVVLREIIDAPVLKGAGYSNILDANGNYVLKTIKTFEGDILPDNKEKIAEVIRDTGRGDFILTDRQGVRQMLVILPIIEGQWYQASMVPVDVLRSSYIQTAWGIMIIIVVACSLFIWLMSRQRKMAVNNQKMLMELAYSDSLTGLRNFAGFKREVEIFLNRPEISRSELTSYVLWYG